VKHLKRKRKSNYSVRETQTLIREIHKRSNVLFSRQQNTAINELKRQAWEEVARGVNSLGEGELRTAAEVKRRYLDWRSLMKRKQLQAELSFSSSSSSSLTLKSEYEPSSPEAGSLTSSWDQLLDLSALPKDSHCDWPELTLGDQGSQSMIPPLGVKMEEDQRLEVEKQRLAVESERLVVEKERLAVEKERLRQHEIEHQRLQLEKERLQVERERLRLMLINQSEHVDSSFNLRGWLSLVDLEAERMRLDQERLQLEKERLQFFKFESGRLQIERERLHVEKERMQLHLDHQNH
uniref:Myb/SANT-like DNA-binding domain-containing protein 4 n=1 Tax=Periophthalmus magnuspinnatus TaxID=409849 RepID=A0A3B4AC27_9GOBI